MDADAAKAVEAVGEAAKAVEAKKEAEAAAAAARAEAEVHKTALADAKRTAREELEGEAAAKVNFVMRQAAAEIKTKVGEAEARTQQAVDRAVAEAVAATRRQADAERREALAAAEVEWGKKLAVVQAQSVSGVGMKIAQVQEGQQERVQHAVQLAVAATQDAAEKREKLAVKAAMAKAAADTEARLAPEVTKLERQLAAVAKGSVASEAAQRETAIAYAVKQERDRGAAELRAAVGAARAEAEARARVQEARMAEAVQNRIREAVTAREKELLADHGRALSELAAQEILEQDKANRALAITASEQWGADNEDFEEEVMARSRPLLLAEEVESVEEASVRRKERMMQEGDGMEGVEAAAAEAAEAAEAEAEEAGDGKKKKKKGKGKKGKEKANGTAAVEAAEAKVTPPTAQRAERAPAQPSELTLALKAPPPTASEVGDGEMAMEDVAVVRLRERHMAEVKALRARQESEARMMEDAGVASEAAAERHSVEMDALRARQLEEAVALGATVGRKAQLQHQRAEALRAKEEATLERKKGRELQQRRRQQQAAETTFSEEAQLLASALAAAEQLERLQADGGADDEASVVELGRSLTRVQQLERQLEQMQLDLGKPQKGIQQALEEQKTDHAATAQKLDKLLKTPPPSGGAAGGAAMEALEVLESHARQAEAMESALVEMEGTIVAGGSSEAKAEKAALEREMEGEREEREAASSKLALMIEAAKEDGGGELAEADLADLSSTMLMLKTQEERVARREAQVAEMYEAARAARRTRLQDAKRGLEKLRKSAEAPARAASVMKLQLAPVAAPESFEAIAVDWVAPPKADAAYFHLQWREHGTDKWQSSKASEAITVPCCTKGGLRTDVPYEFRVRARGITGAWGPFSEPSEPCCPADGLDKMPTRPEVWPAADCGVRLQWEDPSNGWEPLKYEVQWRKCGEPKWPPKDVIETSKPELTIDGLSPTTHYLFRVRALVSTRSQQTKWTEWGPSSAPVQPLDDDSMADSGDRRDARKQALVERDLQKMGLRLPSRPAAAGEEGDGDGDDDVSAVGTSVAGTTVIEQQVIRAAAGIKGEEEAALAMRALEQLKAHDADDDATLRRFEQRHAQLTQRDMLVMDEQLEAAQATIVERRAVEPGARRFEALMEQSGDFDAAAPADEPVGPLERAMAAAPPAARRARGAQKMPSGIDAASTLD
jgi:hypothetical protein